LNAKSAGKDFGVIGGVMADQHRRLHELRTTRAGAPRRAKNLFA